MQTVECTMDGCTKQTHHICQIEWQTNTNSEERTFCCVDCHDGANAYRNLWLNPTTTAPIPSRDRIAQPLPPLNHDGTSGDAGHSPQSRVPRGRGHNTQSARERRSATSLPPHTSTNSSNSPPPFPRRPRTRSQTSGRSINQGVRQRRGDHVQNSNSGAFGKMS